MSAAKTPPTTAAPPTGFTFSAKALEGLVPAALAVAVPELVGAALEAPDDEGVAEGTLVGWRVPQELQALEPGFWVRHWAKVASQMKFGSVPWY